MKKILFVTVVAILLVIINNLIRSIYDIWQKKDFVTEAQKELSFQKQEGQRLKSALSYSKTREFIEKQARDKLLMVKKGEQRILISKDSEEAVKKEKVQDPNWKQWWNLFF
ncbi:MAG: septum formation initiator family protein [Candidatus Levybacteria bacterium]|nr:septum formation initiator family protein [Candidatus Levybacteria bacterium]